MTDPTPEPEATTSTTVIEASATPDGDTSLTDDRAGKEAAKYRTRLRETETERDDLRSQLAAMRTAEVERIVAQDQIMKPAALWASGAVLEDLLTDEGNIDPDKVVAAIAQARDALGIPAIPRAPSPEGLGNAGASIWSTEPSETDNSWGEALRP